MSSTPSVSQSAASCEICGRTFKNSRGVRIHMGHAHKESLHKDNGDTTQHTELSRQQVATVNQVNSTEPTPDISSRNSASSAASTDILMHSGQSHHRHNYHIQETSQTDQSDDTSNQHIQQSTAHISHQQVAAAEDRGPRLRQQPGHVT